MASVQGHSGGIRIDPQLQNTVLIPYGWTDYIYHVGSWFDYRSIYEGDQVESEFCTSLLADGRKDDVFRASQLKIGWTEEQVKHMDYLAIEDHTYHATRARAVIFYLAHFAGY